MLHQLTNANGVILRLQDTGAGIASVVFPDRNGNMADIVLGYKDPNDYYCDGPCLGKIPGRFANRIDKGIFTIDSTRYHLNINNGPNHLHGGPLGFANKVWEYEQAGPDRAVFTLKSADGDENYPGNMTVKATYTLTDNDVITLELEADTDAPTIINLTNHTYWNLRGENSGSVLGQKVRINAGKWLPTTASQIPTGELSPVAGTPMDFRKEKTLGQDIETDFEALKIGKGYDHCWMVDGPQNELRQAVVMTDDLTGRRLEVWSDQPGVQMYTGNWLSGSPIGKSGRSYKDYEGVAFESQNFPDAVNHPDFPSAILRPGEHYSRRIEFRLSAEK